MMLDLLVASISNEWQYSESKQPLDAVTAYLSKTVLGDIDSLKGFSKAKHDGLYYASPSYHNESKANLMSGKMNLGAFALSNSHHMLAQAVALQFKGKNEISTRYGIRSLDKINSDEPNYWDMHPKSGKPIKIYTLISDWLSAMVNAHVDVAKDAYINRLNVRKLTLNTVNLLLRGGKGESTFYFMTQDILTKFSDAFDKYSGVYGVNLGGETAENKAYQEVLDEYLEKYNSLKSSSDPVLDSTYNAEPLPKEEVTKLFNIDYLRGIIPTENTAEWYLAQLKVLQAYQELQPAAKALSQSVTTSQIDTKKFGNNFALQQSFLIKMLAFYKNDKMFKDVTKVVSNTFLKDKLIAGVIKPREYFSSMLIRTTPVFEEMRNTIYAMLGKPEYLQSRTVNNITRMLESSFKVKFFIDYAKANGINPRFLLYGSNSIPRRLTKLKNDIKDGKYPTLLNSDGSFSNALLDNIDEVLRYSDEDRVLPMFLSLKANKDDDHNIDDHIIRAWEELFDSERKELQDFARDLAIYAMIASGDSFGANNIFRYVPNSFRETCGYYDFIRSIENDSSKLADYVDYDMIFKNLWWDDNVVKPVPFKVDSYSDQGVPIKLPRGVLITSNERWVMTTEKGVSKPIRLPIQVTVPEARTIYDDGGSNTIFTPYIKIDFGAKNNPLTTFVYKFVATRLEGAKIVPIYQVVEKRGMNTKGKTIVDFGFASMPITIKDVLGEETKVKYNTGVSIDKIIPPTGNYNSYIEELTDILNGKSKEPEVVLEKESISNTENESNTQQPVVEEEESLPTLDTGNMSKFTFADGTVIPTEFELNDQQKNALLALEEYYNSDDVTFTLQGYAGTGKTTIMKIFDAWLKSKGITPLYLSPTNRANFVTLLNNPNVYVKTLHSLLGLKPYEDLASATVNVKNIKFSADEQKRFVNATFIIDECSMINSSVYKALVSACKIFGINNKLVFLGDKAQLKPINEEVSLVFSGASRNAELTKVERTGDNAILDEATRLRNGEELTYKTSINSKGQGVQYYSDGNKVLSEMMRMIQDPRNETNPFFFRVLAGTNAAVAGYNKLIREKLFGSNPPKLVKGETLMAYRSEILTGNERIPYEIVNSLDYKIVSDPIPTKQVLPYSNGIEVNGYTVTIQNTFIPNASNKTIFVLGDNSSDTILKIINRIDHLNQIKTLLLKKRNRTGLDQKRLSEVINQEKVFNNSFFTMEDITYNRQTKKAKTFDYNYAHTVDKSQGGTYDNVMVLGSDIEQNFEMDPERVKQLKYVGITRAKNKVFYESVLKPDITVEENTVIPSDNKVGNTNPDVFNDKNEFPDKTMDHCKH